MFKSFLSSIEDSFNKTANVICSGILLVSFVCISASLTITSETKKRTNEQVILKEDNEFQPYIASFVKNAKENGVDLTSKLDGFSVGFVETKFATDSYQNDKHRYIGWCFIFDNRVVIDREYWNGLDEETKHSLIHHELGHCLLGRIHDEQLKIIKGKNVPISLMHPKVVDSQTYSEHKIYYLSELFSDKNKFDKLKDVMMKGKSKNTSSFTSYDSSGNCSNDSHFDKK